MTTYLGSHSHSPAKTWHKVNLDRQQALKSQNRRDWTPFYLLIVQLFSLLIPESPLKFPYKALNTKTGLERNVWGSVQYDGVYSLWIFVIRVKKRNEILMSFTWKINTNKSKFLVFLDTIWIEGFLTLAFRFPGWHSYYGLLCLHSKHHYDIIYSN